MASDDMTTSGAALGAPDAPEPEPAPVVTARGMAERARRRKLAILALLLVLLAILAYTVYYFEQNRRLPIPTITPATTGIEPPQYLYSIAGSGANALSKPIGVAVSRDNRVYVVDFITRGVKVFATDGTFLFAFNKISDGANTALRNPVHLAIGPNGDVFVTDRRLQSILVFDRDGKYLRKVQPNNDPDFVWSPNGVTVDANGDIYIADIAGVEQHGVLVLAKDGKVKRYWGKAGLVLDARSKPGTFSYPNGIVVSPGEGNKRDVYVADSNNRRVQVFAPDGTFRRIVATEGTPRGLGIDAEKRLYAVDVLSHQIDIFAQSGQHLATFGENGYGAGQFQYPEDLAIDGRGRIYIADRENNQVQVWGFRRADIPGVTKVRPGQWGWCLAPLPLLLLPLLLRRRRFIVTPDFIEGMVVAELVPSMVNRRWRWIIVQDDHPKFVGRVVDGVDLGELLEAEPYSHSDASALASKLGIALDRAGVLAMARRARILCTEDADLARLAVLLDIDVYDRAAFVRRFVERGR